MGKIFNPTANTQPQGCSAIQHSVMCAVCLAARVHRHLKICDAAHGVERLHRSDNILENKLYYRIYTCKIAKYRVYWLSNLLINSWRAVFYEKSYIQGCRQACRRIPNNRFLCNEQYPPMCLYPKRPEKKCWTQQINFSIFQIPLPEGLKPANPSCWAYFFQRWTILITPC